ncbi:MAG: DUF4270 family protein, partial [Bacteroidales bacterium]|nr:DUF4270 family protein [Bacteroidales bacterium]
MEKITFRWAIISIFAIFATFTACNDDDSAIGTGIMPSSDTMEFCCDTINVETYVCRDTIVQTQNRSVNPIGSITDPYFGQTTAECAFHVLLGASNANFSQELSNETILNSAKLQLQLKYIGKFGDTTSNMTIKINRLKKLIDVDSTYYEKFRLQSNEYEDLASQEL